jgi:beta-galactosidase
MLKSATVERLRKYVEDGGTLISEGLPAYFGDHGRAGPTQPNFGLDRLFGARERYVEFTPDLLDNLTLEVQGKTLYGRYFLQEFEAAGGQAAGRYQNGHVAAVENRSGKGRTLLIGTFPGAGYYRHHSADAKAFFAGLLKFGGVEPRLRTDNPAVQARLHTGGGVYLWVVNPTRAAAKVNITITEQAFQAAEDVWAGRPVAVSGRKVSVEAPPRDAAVIALR